MPGRLRYCGGSPRGGAAGMLRLGARGAGRRWLAAWAAQPTAGQHNQKDRQSGGSSWAFCTSQHRAPAKCLQDEAFLSYKRSNDFRGVRMTQQYDVASLGNAIVDIIASVDDRLPADPQHRQGRHDPDRRVSRQGTAEGAGRQSADHEQHCTKWRAVRPPIPWRAWPRWAARACSWARSPTTGWAKCSAIPWRRPACGSTMACGKTSASTATVHDRGDARRPAQHEHLPGRLPRG